MKTLNLLWRNKPVIVDRLIDAIYIFSSALQDKDKSSKIIKLTTALERLVSLSNKESNDVSINFRKRVAILVSIYHDDFDKWNEVAKEMYDIRSSIIHGSWSLYKDIEPLYVDKYSELTSKAILTACIGFYKRGLESDSNDTLLKEYYEFLEQAVMRPKVD